MPDEELDVRTLRKPDKHPTIFATYDALQPGEALVLVNNHDPKHLRDEFEVEHPGSYSWEYVEKGPKAWRVRIGKLSSTPLPRVLYDTGDVGEGRDADASGAVWKLPMRERDLDSNIIHLSAGATIDEHTGPDIDVLIHVLGGSGRLTTELGVVDLTPGELVWLPRRSRREFTAGSAGLRYLTVHQRRQSLMIQAAPTAQT